MKQNYKPVPRVRLTMTLAVQNRVLHQLSAAFGICETWDRKHEITCHQSDFAYFMSLVAQMENPPTVKQLGVEYIDVRKDVLRTTVQQRNVKWNGEDPEPEEPEVKVVAASSSSKVREAATKADDVLVALTACNDPLGRLERLYGKLWHKEIDEIRRDLCIALNTDEQP